MTEPKPLTPNEIERLASYGIKYPWVPQDVLKLIDRLVTRSRDQLPINRQSLTRRFSAPWPEERCPHCGEIIRADKLRIYTTVSLYDAGNPGEIFFSADQIGGFAHGLMASLAMATSIALQYGAPIEKIVKQWRATRFPPEGFTGDPDFPRCTSLLDLVGQWLEKRFITS